MIFDQEDYKAFDPEIWEAVAKEEERQQHNIELIASENVVSKAVMAAQGSILTNKYAEGYPGRRYYGGTDVVDVQLNEPRKSLVPSLLMFSLTQVARLIALLIWL